MSQDQYPVIDYEGSDYQSSFWDAGGRAYEDQAEALALRRLLPAGGSRLLEIGAGAGRNTPRYQGYKQIVLLDYSFTQLLQAQQRLGEASNYVYVAADAYHLPFAPNQFDASTMIRTLHHMVNAPAVLDEVAQILGGQAVFILEYANKQNFKAIMRYIARRQTWNPFSLEPIEFERLNFDFHPRAVRAWLKQSGFLVGRQLTVSHFRMAFLKRTLPLKLLTWMDGLAQWTGDWWQLSPSVFVRSRRADAGPVLQGDLAFRCPECRTYPLDQSAGELNCRECGRRYARVDGIYDFRQPIA